MSVVVPVQVRHDRRSDLDTVSGALADRHWLKVVSIEQVTAFVPQPATVR